MKKMSFIVFLLWLAAVFIAQYNGIDFLKMKFD